MSAWCCNVLFCTNEARSFGPLGFSLSELCRTASGGFSSHYLGLGRFDHILVTMATEEADLLRPEKKVQKCPHTTSHWSCFGRVIDGSFDPAAGLPSDCGVLLGVCVIKLAHRLRDALPELDPVAEAIREALKGIPGHWMLSSTTGWEDLVLLFWTNEFLTLSQALARVRGLKIQKVMPALTEGVHAVLTTCTLTGVSLPAGVFDAGEKKFLHTEWVRRMGAIQSSALVDWALRFEVRPGHMDPFKQELLALATQIGQLSIADEMCNVLGQYDFRIQCQAGTQKDWLQFLGNVALPLAARTGSLVRSMETHLHIRFQECSEGPSKSDVFRPAAQSLPQSVLQSIQHSCGEFGIAPHTVEVLDATYSRLQALRGDDLQQGTFESVASLFTHLADGLQAMVKQQDAGRPPVEAEFLDRDFCSWLCWMERCLADRYRGTYPLGESIITRVGTYQASYHGFLAAMDCIAQEAYDLAREFCNRAHSEQPSIPAVTVCSFIGSAPSPNILSFPHLRCGFIELPPGMIFRLHELPVLLHEVGHLFERVVSHHFKFDYDSKAGQPVTIQIREILAEAFACFACFGQDLESYVRHRLSLMDTYLPQPESKFATSHSLITNIRLAAVHWLPNKREGFTAQDAQDACREFRNVVDSLVKGELDSALQGDERAQAEEEARKAVKPCESAFFELAWLYHRRPDFRVMLDAMRSLQDLSARASTLKALPFAQAFIRKGSRHPADHFRFIEAMVARAAS
jgi:hypothetical protein